MLKEGEGVRFNEKSCSEPSKICSLKKIFFLFFIVFFISMISAAGYAPINYTTFILHNESDSILTNYKIMQNTSVDSGLSTELLSLATNGNTYCFTTKWISSNYSLGGLFNGTWTFNMYSNCSKNLANNQYYTLARIIKVNSTGEYNVTNTTTNGVACTTGAPVLKNWTYAVPYSDTLNLTAGERVGVQFCIRIAGGAAATTRMQWEDNFPSSVNIPVQLFDNQPPLVNVSSPILNYRYSNGTILVNFSAIDTTTAISSLWFNNGTDNITYTSPVYITLAAGNKSLLFYANDSVNNLNYTQVNFTINQAPNLSAIYAYPSPIKGGNTITINATASDLNNDSLSLYCTELNQSPISSNSYCTGGNTYMAPPYNLTCTYATTADSSTHTVYCALFDGLAYSQTLNTTYTTNSTVLTTSVISVAGDTTPSYIDNVNDGRTDILVSGQNGMSCRWSPNDLSYSSMSNDCTISGSTANCSVTGISQGFNTEHVSCMDSLGNEQNANQNLDISFYLDYTAPTTSDNSTSDVKLPGYSATITESDNVDPDPKTYYCIDTTNSCTPTTAIDNGSSVSFSTRGANYFRYYSVDFAGNIQSVQSKTININQLPNFVSAGSSNAGTIQ